MAVDSRRFLVVDDEQQLLAFLRRALTSLGNEVVAEETAAAGLRRHGEEAFGLVLLDLRLGDTDGLEVLRRMKAQNSSSAMPSMLCSSSSRMRLGMSCSSPSST